MCTHWKVGARCAASSDESVDEYWCNFCSTMALSDNSIDEYHG